LSELLEFVLVVSQSHTLINSTVPSFVKSPINNLTEFTAIEQSNIGTTIDYYLAPQNQDNTLIFNHAARLEVSGILEENPDNTVDKRIGSKIRRLKPDPNGALPTFILVVEFSQPHAKMVQHE
jgi:hypothetical protein